MIKIITDTTSCIDAEFAHKHNISVIPQLIHINGKTYREGEDIEYQSFLQLLQSSRELPKTAAPPPEFFTKVFAALDKDIKHVLCIHPSSEISGTVRSATIASQDFPQLNIHVIDTRLIATPLGELVKLSTEWIKTMSAESVANRIKSLAAQCHIYFLVPTLTYLAKGGRIGGAAAILGNALQIKPLLTLVDGRVEVESKQRTNKRAFSRMLSLVKQHCPSKNHHITIMHANAETEAIALAEEIASHLGINHIPIAHVPPAIITHAGPGVIGVAFFKESKWA